jgi:hypothetical protein
MLLSSKEPIPLRHKFEESYSDMLTRYNVMFFGCPIQFFNLSFDEVNVMDILSEKMEYTLIDCVNTLEEHLELSVVLNRILDHHLPEYERRKRKSSFENFYNLTY